MKKIIAIVLAAVMLSSGAAFADSFEIINEDKLPSELSGWLVKTICAEGQVFLVSFVLGASAGAAIHAVQVYEERDGKTLPMRCRGKKRK